MHALVLMPCACAEERHACRLVVLTGGPGAGKTATLEVVRRHFCRHIAVLPEAASIVFGGGFPRRDDPTYLRAAQRAIFHVQRELERAVIEAGETAVALCDRGTVDGLAYWNEAPDLYWRDVGSTRDLELARYAAVIHLRTPREDQGYDHRNPVRIESAGQAALMDARIAQAWEGHPRHFFVESSDDFLAKLAQVVTLVRAEVPGCCRSHTVEEIGEPSGGAKPCD